jgi:hypothetical protein
MAITKDEFEAFRGDLIAYLAHKFQITREEALTKLGDWLIEPAGRESRAMAHARHHGGTAEVPGRDELAAEPPTDPGSSASRSARLSRCALP